MSNYFITTHPLSPLFLPVYLHHQGRKSKTRHPSTRTSKQRQKRNVSKARKKKSRKKMCALSSIRRGHVYVICTSVLWSVLLYLLLVCVLCCIVNSNQRDQSKRTKVLVIAVCMCFCVFQVVRASQAGGLCACVCPLLSHRRSFVYGILNAS